MHVLRICRYASDINKYLFMESTKISPFNLQTKKININIISPVQMTFTCPFINQTFIHSISKYLLRAYYAPGVCQVLGVRRSLGWPGGQGR